ncbi:MAG TPA: hypothetical protein VEW95_09235 [Candidatus Limnocylindrales bacterium]|nr:hypothetical protein [Candidatus Limnocylindrales bacterium]
MVEQDPASLAELDAQRDQEPTTAPATSTADTWANEPLTLTRGELREGIAAVFYRSMPAWDADGQERIDRATDRVLEAVGR